ncbi:DUF3617 domain-containing protein [Thauera sp. SWB20]|uniref:DUF3617 domain-containing protein n=1 Tax=Thauera sp. SWB20 TaxID=1572758 RepID=UPI0005ADA1E0|nr:DUF3617 domain-containing protein [Thauera sp. SWB20]KIN91085.1 hypothetical protein PO78_2486 [Thauera sp. SWB20]
MTPIRAAALALVLTCAVPAAHALDDLRPGLWEFRSTRLSLAGLPDMAAQMDMLQQHIKGLPADTRRMLEQQMQQRGVSLGADGSVRSCITPAQARQDNVFAGKVEGNCTLTRVERSGNTIRGSLRCTDPDAEGDFHARVEGPEHFTTRVKLASVRGDLDLETDARWLGAGCGAAAVAPKPAR